MPLKRSAQVIEDEEPNPQPPSKYEYRRKPQSPPKTSQSKRLRSSTRIAQQQPSEDVETTRIGGPRAANSKKRKKLDPPAANSKRRKKLDPPGSPDNEEQTPDPVHRSPTPAHCPPIPIRHSPTPIRRPATIDGFDIANGARPVVNEPTTTIPIPELGPAQCADGTLKDASELGPRPHSADEDTPLKLQQLSTATAIPELGPAQRADGTLKDASEMLWTHSADEATPVKLTKPKPSTITIKNRPATPGPSRVEPTNDYDSDLEVNSVDKMQPDEEESGTEGSEYAAVITASKERKILRAKLASVQLSSTDEDATDFEEFLNTAIPSPKDTPKSQPARKRPSRVQISYHSDSSDSEEENQETLHKTGLLTKKERQILAEIDQLHQKKYEELANQFNRPLSSILAHITGGHKFSRRRNAHNARQQVQRYLRKFEGVENPALSRARDVINSYGNLPLDRQESQIKKEELDKEIRAIAEGLEEGIYDGYVKEGNVYKVMDKFKEEVRRQIYWYSKNFGVKSVFALWPGPGVTNLKSMSRASIVSCSESVKSVFLHGSPHVQQALQVLKSFADVTELTQGDMGNVSPQTKTKAMKAKEKVNRERAKASDAGGNTRDSTRAALTAHLKNELRKHDIPVSDKVQWGSLANVLYKHRLCLRGWNSRHYRGVNGGKPEYFGIGGVTIRMLTASQLKDIQKCLDSGEGPFITTWASDDEELSLMQMAKVPLLVSRSGESLITVIECSQYLEDVRMSKKQGKKKVTDEHAGEDSDFIRNPTPRPRSPMISATMEDTNDLADTPSRWFHPSPVPPIPPKRPQPRMISRVKEPTIPAETCSTSNENSTTPTLSTTSIEPSSHNSDASHQAVLSGPAPAVSRPVSRLDPPSTRISEPQREIPVRNDNIPSASTTTLPGGSTQTMQQSANPLSLPHCASVVTEGPHVQTTGPYPYPSIPSLPLFTSDGRPYYFGYPPMPGAPGSQPTFDYHSRPPMSMPGEPGSQPMFNYHSRNHMYPAQMHPGPSSQPWGRDT